MKQKPKIGLALGAGPPEVLLISGAAGIRRNWNKVDYIAGSSIGSIVGALYAAGVSPKMMEGLAYNIDAKLCYDLGFSRRGFIQEKSRRINKNVDEKQEL